MKYLKTIGISLGASILVAFIVLNLPLGIIDLSAEPELGATITTINATDRLKDSRSVINTNFANLNVDKIEISTTTLPNITTLANLTTIGTIGTGVWQGTAIGVGYGGTGTTSPTTNQIMFGNGVSGFQVIGFGTSGESLVSGGDGVLPSWTSVSFDTSANQTLTGLWDFQATTTMATTTIQDLIATNLTVASSTFNQWANASTSPVTKGYFDENNGSKRVFLTAGSFDDADANASITQSEYVSVVRFADGVTGVPSNSLQVPAGATSISSIKLLYKRQAAADVKLRFFFSHFNYSTGTQTQDTSDASTAYTSAASNNSLGIFTVPTGAYDNIPSLSAGDIIGMQPVRFGAEAGDTYNAVFDMIGIEVLAY